MASPIKLTKIDDGNRDAHFHLNADDECYFLHEYTSGKDYNYGRANRLISNLKKKPSTISAAAKPYKIAAINECAGHFSSAINMDWLKHATLVPVPPSKIVGHPDFDNRMTRICNKIVASSALDVRELVVQTVSLPASHEGTRHSVDDLLRVYQINPTLALPKPNRFAIFDDMLTAGAHFRAMHTLLQRHYPNVPIVGFFVARRIFPNAAEYFEDIDL